MMTKAGVRSAIRERIERMNAVDRERESRSICKRIAEYIGAEKKHIAAYLPLGDEPNIAPLLREYVEKQWTVSVPVMERNRLIFYRLHDLEKTQPGKFRILEPIDSDRTDQQLIDIVLVPGRAFTADGHRLGRGNGGYDYWIEEQRQKNPDTIYMGIGFDCQILNEIPVEKHDQKLDAIITARGIIESTKH